MRIWRACWSASRTGSIDYTIADSSLFKIYRNFLPEIRIGFEIASDDSLAWAFPRRNDRQPDRTSRGLHGDGPETTASWTGSKSAITSRMAALRLRRHTALHSRLPRQATDLS